MTNTGGTLLATGGGELDVKAATITDNLGGTEQINTGSELLVDSGHPDAQWRRHRPGWCLSARANHRARARVMSWRTPTRRSLAPALIGNLDLVNDAAGTIDATGILTIETGNTITNAGLLEATGRGTLDVKDALSNSDDVTASGSGSTVTLEGNVTNTGGTLLATGGGGLDVKAATITDNLGGTEQINAWLGAGRRVVI